ncbi:hypothetical protein C8R42DRAFT_645707 [Lentinula raphanica]|nr:hypothetical protein C8R42DRAFT_645707 [Lentinula raphanica]
MPLFRLFTWHLLAVHVVILSMIAAAIVLPMDSSMTQSDGTRKRDRETAGLDAAGLSSDTAVAISSQSRDSHTPTSTNQRPPKKQRKTESNDVTKTCEFQTILKEYVIAVVIGGHAKQSAAVDPTADWVIAFIPSEYYLVQPSRKQNPKATGYRTIRNTASNSHFKWKRQVNTKHPKSINGAQVTVSPSRLNFTIGTVTMSQETRAELGRDMRAAVDDYRVDKLPNVPSIYQFAVLLRRQLDKVKYRGTVTVHSFNISDSSEFGKAFDEMVRKKGTGAGDELSEEEDKWEWELYKRIQSKAIDLERSLDVHNNRGILEDLWDEVKILSQYVIDGHWDVYDGVWGNPDEEWKDHHVCGGSCSPDPLGQPM